MKSIKKWVLSALCAAAALTAAGGVRADPDGGAPGVRDGRPWSHDGEFGRPSGDFRPDDGRRGDRPHRRMTDEERQLLRQDINRARHEIYRDPRRGEPGPPSQ